MGLQTVTLSQIVPSKANPRKNFDLASIQGLAESIKTDGLLQNLVVRPVKGKKERYAIISGERRYRALKILEQNGDLPEDFTIPVEIRKSLNKEEQLRLATVENLQRANLTPLEECEALTTLVHDGEKLDELAAKTGLSVTTIKRRLILNTLCDEVKAAMVEGEVSLAQAESLTLGNEAMQQRFLTNIKRGYCDYSANDIREELTRRKPTLSTAIFPKEAYSGTITADLFGAEETSYFDDVEQFLELQMQAVEELVKHYETSASWVEVTEGFTIPEWQYREAEKGETGGVLVNVSPHGEVDILENIIPKKMDEETKDSLSDHPVAPKKPKPTYTKPVCRYIAHHKTMAVQEMLLACPRKTLEVAVISAIQNFNPHQAVRGLAKEAEPQTTYAVLEQEARRFALRLGFELEDDEQSWEAFCAYGIDGLAVYHEIKTWNDADLEALHHVLIALQFGQIFCDELDCNESLFNDVAQDLNVDMKNHWRPDRSFLTRRTQARLVQMAKECGFADGRSGIDSYKKSELVESLLRHFDHAHHADAPSAAQQKALDWLPEAMAFPAINPDAIDDTSIEEEDGEFKHAA